MTTSTLTALGSHSSAKISATVAKRSTGLSLRVLLDAFTKGLEMARAIPSTGRISAKQLHHLKEIAKSI